MRTAAHLDARRGDALAQQVITRIGFESLQCLSASRVSRRIERSLDRATAYCTTTGQADAISGQHTRERMQQHLVGTEQPGHGARVLPCRAAEREQAAACRVFAVVQGEFANRVGHACAGDLQEGFGQRLHAVLESRFVAGRRGQLGESRARGSRIDRLIARRAEDVRKMIHGNASQHDIAIGDRGGAVAAVTRRPGIGAGRSGAHLQPAVGEPQHRTTARRDRGDVDHRGLQSHPVNLGGEPPRNVAGGQADVRRRASHVEADQPSRAVCGTGGNHPDHAPGGTRQNAVHAAKALGIDEPAVALHEGDGRVAVRPAQARAETPCVAQQNG